MRWFVHHEARNQKAHLWKSWTMRNCTIVKCWFCIHPLSHVVEHLRDGSCSDSLLFISIIIIIICSSCGFLHHHNSYIYMRWKPCCRDGSRSRCDNDPRDSIQDCCHMAEDWLRRFRRRAIVLAGTKVVQGLETTADGSPSDDDI